MKKSCRRARGRACFLHIAARAAVQAVFHMARAGSAGRRCQHFNRGGGVMRGALLNGNRPAPRISRVARPGASLRMAAVSTSRSRASASQTALLNGKLRMRPHIAHRSATRVGSAGKSCQHCYRVGGVMRRALLHINLPARHHLPAHPSRTPAYASPPGDMVSRYCVGSMP